MAFSKIFSRKSSAIIIILALLLAGLIIAGFALTKVKKTKPTSVPETSSGKIIGQKDVEVVAENLYVPWEIIFMPNKDIWVTERNGIFENITTGKKIRVDGVQEDGEGGLLGAALHPNYQTNHFLYLYFTTKESGDLMNKVVRYEFDGNSLTNPTTIVDGILANANHDGGRIAFGPDGFLYITTGDAENPNLAQDKTSLNGKILRVADDGSIPADNPFDNAVYSYGHRNPEGLAWNAAGNLWETEHGPSGSETGNDEINMIEKGENYGWPTIKGDQKRTGMVSPIIQSGTSETWAPSGAVFWNGSLFFCGLRGETLYELKFPNRILVKHLTGVYGRLRAIKLGPDGNFYISTSNQDGRGNLNSGDDKIIRINPKSLAGN